MLPPLLVISLAFASSTAHAATAGSFASGGTTLVSAMMMFLGNVEKVYILDKAEGNAAQVNGHAAWGSVWDINTHQAKPMDVPSNVFCASGMHLPNGSYVAFGGNSAVGRGGNAGSQVGPTGVPSWDAEYQDFDGSKAIRILNPCTNSDNFNDPSCQWFDDANLLAMQKRRWYSTAEALADGSIVLIGGFVNGGYINRNNPNTDPEFSGGAAEPTYEFFPANGRPATTMQFMIKTSGLNAYALAWLMPSGKMFVQANVSTILWDYDANVETPLPDMPGGVVRVYPASGASAMLPLTPANNYNPTILFCGGSDMPDDAWGNYANPAIDTWLYPASRDCQRITPEPTSGPAAYEQDDNMLEGRTMGQFIILPDSTLLVVNGGLNGTAGYATATGQTKSYSQMPFGMSLASGPVGTPAIYNPNKPKGQRWSNAGFSNSNIARLYHSSAMLLPDGSVIIAGSNPSVDVNTTAIFPTEYRAEIFYPSYFSASTRPEPKGVPSTISYGGPAFDITIPASSYSGSANTAAGNTTVVLVRGGFTTHAMNMGQRYLQLNNTFTVNKDGSYVLHVSQAPPNANLFQPGPSLMFVNVNGVPSVGTMVIVGSGKMEKQPILPVADLPPNVLLDSATGSGSGTGNGAQSDGGHASHTGVIIGGIVGAVALIGILGAIVGVWLARRRKQGPGAGTPGSSSYMMSGGSNMPFAAGRGVRASDTSAFVPLQQANDSSVWDPHGGVPGGMHTANASMSSLSGAPYKDAPPQPGYMGYDSGSPRGSTGMSIEYDPYSREPRTTGTPLRY